MSISVKVSGAWRSVSSMNAKVSGVWKAAKAVYGYVGSPHRYPALYFPPEALESHLPWFQGNISNISGTPTGSTEGGKPRFTWTAIAAGKFGYMGTYLGLLKGKEVTYTITCSDAPPGVTWCAYLSYLNVKGTDVVGPGTSTLTYTAGVTSPGYHLGIRVTEGANDTTGFLISNMTATPTIADPAPTDPNTSVPFSAKQILPNPGTGTLQIVGVRKTAGYKPYGWTSFDSINFTSPNVAHVANAKWTFPLVPMYRIMGDTSQIASAKVTLTFTPIAPKSPAEHTISWEAPVGWALYHVGYLSTTDGYWKRYIAALTDAEAATLRSNSRRFVTKIWSPKEGGYFAWMPVCWDASGVTVPMLAEAAQGADGTDPYSGYAEFPPTRTATSTLSNYTVLNGYSDMWNNDINYTAVTIELKNSGGTVIASWTGALPAGNSPDQPGKGNTVALREAEPTRSLNTWDTDLQWPEEWQDTFFAHVDGVSPMFDIKFVGFTNIRHEATYEVYDKLNGELAGYFKVGFRPHMLDVGEIRGGYMRPEYYGQGVLKNMAAHFLKFGPWEWITCKQPDQETYDVMASWGMVPLTETPLKFRRFDNEYMANPANVLCAYRPKEESYFHYLGIPSLEELGYG